MATKMKIDINLGLFLAIYTFTLLGGLAVKATLPYLTESAMKGGE